MYVCQVGLVAQCVVVLALCLQPSSGTSYSSSSGLNLRTDGFSKFLQAIQAAVDKINLESVPSSLQSLLSNVSAMESDTAGTLSPEEDTPAEPPLPDPPQVPDTSRTPSAPTDLPIQKEELDPLEPTPEPVDSSRDSDETQRSASSKWYSSQGFLFGAAGAGSLLLVALIYQSQRKRTIPSSTSSQVLDFQSDNDEHDARISISTLGPSASMVQAPRSLQGMSNSAPPSMFDDSASYVSHSKQSRYSMTSARLSSFDQASYIMTMNSIAEESSDIY